MKRVQQRRIRNGIKSFAKIKEDSTDRREESRVWCDNKGCGDESGFSTKTWAKTELTIKENVILRAEVVHP